MKEYKCIMTRDTKHKAGVPTEFTGISDTILDYESRGWHLHTFQTVFVPSDGNVAYTSGFYHHLLFDKEEYIDQFSQVSEQALQSSRS